MEIWLPIKDYPNYEVSSEGRVRNIKTGRIMRQQTNRNGYKNLTLRRDNTQHDVRVHRLVADAFYDGDHYGLDVNHIDGDKTNNFIGNLEWCTRKENIKHALNSGLRVNNNFGKVKTRILDTSTGRVYESINECARVLGIDTWYIRECLKGNRDSYRGHSFERV